MAIFPGSAIPSAGGVYTYAIDQSLRFEDGSSAYLSKTPASAGNRKTWTWSGWVKRGNLSLSYATLFGALGGGGSTETIIEYRSDDKIEIRWYSGGYAMQVISASIYRDASAWYHIAVAIDTTQSTASNRAKLYVNGEQVTQLTTATYPNQNSDMDVNSTVGHGIGMRADAIRPFDGYMAEVHFIDGQALDPSYFGETDETYGIWKPKAYEGTYGTNGFYLDFSNGAAIGADSSGNSNDWTANNLAATDVMPDTPTNNFCTLNPLHFKGTGSRTLLEGNLRNNTSTTGSAQTYGTFAMTSGKWYWEIYINSISVGSHYLGVAKQDSDYNSNQVSYRSDNGNKMIDGTETSYGTSYSTGQIIGVAYNADDDEITFYEDNVSQGTISLSGYGGVDVFPVIQDSSSTAINCTANFGQDSSFAGNKTAQNNTDANGRGDFYYEPPSGFLALCSANLDDPAVVPGENFNTVLYTGDGSNGHAITGVGFQPDLVWGKCRSVGTDHYWVDAVRGVTNVIRSNLTAVEYTQTDSLVSFDTDGFTLDDDNSGGPSGNFNISGRTYAAWNWKADNTSGSSNTDGSITSTVAANPDAGFSIVSYTGTGATGGTVGHGLGVKPNFIIVKRRSSIGGWVCWHSGLTGGSEEDRYIYLSLNSAAGTTTNYWGSTGITSSTFGVWTTGGDNNTLGATLIAYCFHSVPGYSKFGSYIGNNSTDGTFVYTGFRPAFVMVKATTVTAGWAMFDNKREGYNVDNDVLQAESTAAETTTDYVDLLSNGFKFRSSVGLVNTTGGTVYIYMAFASSPFKYSTAR